MKFFGRKIWFSRFFFSLASIVLNHLLHGVFMYSFSGGWNSLENSFPQNITDIISVARATFGAPVDGQIVYDSLFRVPSGGTWAASPITLSQEPDVQAINVTFNSIDGIEAIAMNGQTKMANLSAKVTSFFL